MSSSSPSPLLSNTSSAPRSTARPAETEYRDNEDYESNSVKSYCRLSVNDSDSHLDREPHTPLIQGARESLWRRGLAAISPLSTRDKEAADAIPLLSPTGVPTKRPRRRHRKFRIFRFFLYPLLGFFVMLGIVQFVAIACSIVISFFPDDFDRATDRWRHPPSSTSDDISLWPTDISRDIIPVGCHSHNDYWRPVPLFSALQAGCVGVEADVWLFDKDLYVGHTTSSLTPKRTLKSMYIDPLVRILDQQNPVTKFHPTTDKPLQGVFDTDPAQSVILLIDFKTDGVATWNHVVAQLSPLRERGYLTYFNGTDVVPGPVTVVGTGNTPFNLVTANSTYRDIFFDAPLEMMMESSDSDEIPRISAMRSAENAGQGLSGVPAADADSDIFNWTNSYYASVSFKQTIGFPWSFLLTDRQIDKIRAQIRGAHRRGLKVRYWSLPSWPRSLRNHLWTILVREGVDMLNVDDLQAATQEDWSLKVADWWG